MSSLCSALYAKSYYLGLYPQSPKVSLLFEWFICTVSSLCGALYAKCPYYVVRCMESTLVISALCKVSLFRALCAKCPHWLMLYICKVFASRPTRRTTRRILSKPTLFFHRRMLYLRSEDTKMLNTGSGREIPVKCHDTGVCHGVLPGILAYPEFVCWEWENSKLYCLAWFLGGRWQSQPRLFFMVSGLAVTEPCSRVNCGPEHGLS